MSAGASSDVLSRREVGSPSFTRLFTGGVVGFSQKVLDLFRYVTHRSWMLLRFRARQIQHRWLFQGRLHRILVVRIASIGDVARATGVVARLRNEYPEATIDFLTSPAALAVIRGHSAVQTVYTLSDLDRLGQYDWVINLQTRNPPDSFLRPTHRAYHEVLTQLSKQARPRLHSGRRLVSEREVISTNILYCRSEMEELFLIALQDFNPERYPETAVHPDPKSRAAVSRSWPLPRERPVAGVFLGSNSVGRGADEGFRTYSIDYLERLILHLAVRFTVVVIGQSHMRTADEMAQYRTFLARHHDIVDLVDKTSLDELVAVIAGFSLLVSSDSSPVHIALATGVPVVGLYVADAAFRMSPRLSQEGFVAINSRAPCFYFSWRWRFFCGSCRDSRTRARYCELPPLAFGVDRIPIAEIDRAIGTLLPTIQPPFA
jgi:ADP-heptose:LPS heptosyltransferase